MPTPIKLGLSRRAFLGLSGLIATTVLLPGCGSALSELGEVEGEDFFTVPFKVLNLAALESSVSISSGGTQYVSQLPYLKIASGSAKLDMPVQTPDSLIVQGASGDRSTFSNVPIQQSLYMVTSTSPTGFRLSNIGGVPGPYPRNNETTPRSVIQHSTSVIGPVRVLCRTRSSANLEDRGELQNGGSSIAMPQEASNEFQLVLKLAADGSTVFDSGVRTKAANTFLVIARRGPVGTAAVTELALVAVDGRFDPQVW